MARDCNHYPQPSSSICLRLRLHYLLTLLTDCAALYIFRTGGVDTPTRVVVLWLSLTRYIMPLKGIPFILSPDLLYVLSAAGHGDEIGK